MSVPDHAGGPPGGRARPRRLPDPLAPAEVLRRGQALRKTVRGIPAGAQQVITGGMLVLGVCLGVLVGMATGSALAWFVTALVSALALAVGEVWWQMHREARAARELRGLQVRWSVTVPDGEAGELAIRIVDDIAALPVLLRADFAPLMATVRECCTALAHAPTGDHYLAMLRERAVLVRQVREEYEAVAAVQRDQEAMERFAGDTAGEDLAIATQIRDALAAVRTELGGADTGRGESAEDSSRP